MLARACRCSIVRPKATHPHAVIDHHLHRCCSPSHPSASILHPTLPSTLSSLLLPCLSVRSAIANHNHVSTRFFHPASTSAATCPSRGSLAVDSSPLPLPVRAPSLLPCRTTFNPLETACSLRLPALAVSRHEAVLRGPRFTYNARRPSQRQPPTSIPYQRLDLPPNSSILNTSIPLPPPRLAGLVNSYFSFQPLPPPHLLSFVSAGLTTSPRECSPSLHHGLRTDLPSSLARQLFGGLSQRR